MTQAEALLVKRALQHAQRPDDVLSPGLGDRGGSGGDRGNIREKFAGYDRRDAPDCVEQAFQILDEERTMKEEDFIATVIRLGGDPPPCILAAGGGSDGFADDDDEDERVSSRSTIILESFCHLVNSPRGYCFLVHL